MTLTLGSITRLVLLKCYIIPPEHSFPNETKKNILKKGIDSRLAVQPTNIRNNMSYNINHITYTR